MVTNATYSGGNGNAMSGLGAGFGAIYDLQMADDCTGPLQTGTYVINQVCAASLTFLGVAPATAVWVQVYADAGGVPANTVAFQEIVPPGSFTSTPFTDTVFGFQGQTICATITSITLPAGTWWFNIQPIDTTAGGDWFYQVRDANPPVGADIAVKDGQPEHGTAFGGPHNVGYGFGTWTSSGAAGFGAGNAAFSVNGTLIPVEIDSFEIE